MPWYNAHMAVESFRRAVGSWSRHTPDGSISPWEDLKHYITAFQCNDKVFKAEALQFLSFFLPCISSPSHFTCPDMYTVCVCFGDKHISFELSDVQNLFELLLSELRRFSDCFFEASCKYHRHNSCCHADMEIALQVLRCCIRILPLLEFDTSLSLVASEVLGFLLHKLCCQSTVYKFIVARDVDCGKTSFPLGARCAYPHHEIPAASARCTGFSNHHDVSDVGKHVSSYRVACALIEVFIDELVLWPELAEVLWQQYMKSEIRLMLIARHNKVMGMCMSVAFVHLMIASLEDNAVIASAPALSLPGAVALLDASVIDNLPHVFIAHIGFLVARVLDICDMYTWPSELVLGLCSSVLETSVKLYIRVCVVPVPGKENIDCDSPLNILFKLLLKNYGNILAMSIVDGCSLQSGLDGSLKEVKCICRKGQVTASAQCYCDKCSDILMKSNRALFSDKRDHLQETNELDSLNPSLASEKECVAVKHIQPCNLYNSCIANPLLAILKMIGSSLQRLVKEISIKKVCSWIDVASGGESFCTNEKNYLLFFELIKDIFRFCVPKSSMDIQSGRTDATNDVPSEAVIVIWHALQFFLDRLSSELQNAATEFSLNAHSLILDSLASILNFDNKKGFGDLDARMLQTLVQNLQQNPVCQENISTLNNYLCKVLHNNDTHGNNSDEEQLKPSENVGRGDCDESCSPVRTSTLDIVRRYKQKCLQVTTVKPMEVTHRSQDSRDSCVIQSSRRQGCDKQEASVPNPYIQQILKQEGRGNSDCFEDLADFIVYKKGRDYSKWLKARLKYREKHFHRLYWKRKFDKRQFMALLFASDHLL